MGKKILIATEKPFAKGAIDRIQKFIDKSNGYQLELLEKYQNSSDLIQKVHGVDGLIVRSDKITDLIIEAGSQLKIIVRAGTGVDNIDLEAAKGRDIIVMNTPGQNSTAVAELAFGLMLGLIRNKYNGNAGTELRGKCIALHGFGHVAKCMSLMAKGFNMELSAYDPFVDAKQIALHGVHPCETVEELYQMGDFISLNIPLKQQTERSINYELLSNSKPTALLLNTARKELVDEEGLMKLMAERDQFKYTADVAPDCQDLLMKKYPDRVLFTTKKMGAQTLEANENAGVAAVSQIVDYFENGDTHYRVN